MNPSDFGVICEPLESRWLFSGVAFYVATTGSDAAAGDITQPFETIQHALNVATKPGDMIFVRGGTYDQRLTFPHSGSAAGGPITLENYPGEHVLLSGQNAADNDAGFGENMIQITNKSYIKVSGFEIADDSGVAVGDDAFAIRVQGSGTGIQILDNTIHDITGDVTSSSDGINVGSGGAGINVYGTSLAKPYSNITISGNTIYNCQPGDDSTETLTVNGNVNHFSIVHNIIHDDNNIGIDMIGGEADTFNKPDGTPNLPGARNGVCSDNTVYNIHANYGGGFAAGIYVDGGKNIIIQRNQISYSDLGIEVGAENHGYIASGVIVRDNIIDNNTQGGLVFGGYDQSVGRVQKCRFTNNTLYHNDTTNQGDGEIWIQYATNNVIEDNIVYSTSQDLLINSPYTRKNTSKYNLLFCDEGSGSAEFVWGGNSYTGLASYRSGSRQDQKSIFANPGFTDGQMADFFDLATASPAIDAGDPSFARAVGETDFFGDARLKNKRVDIGAVEFD